MDSSNKIIKNNKYNNENNIGSKDNILDISEISKTNNDIIKLIDNEAKKFNDDINEKDLKIFNKYEDLSDNELVNLIKEKNQYIIKLSDQKDKIKKSLNKIIKNLNNAISNNADILCKEEVDPEAIIELEKTLTLKKKELKLSKNMNQTLKSQYKSMTNKLSGNNKAKEEKKINDLETNLIKLKNENKNLELQIRKYKDDEISNQKELEIICENKLYPAKIKMKSDEYQNILNQKNLYNNKINMCLNSIKNLIKEINHLEQIRSSLEKNKDNENISNKINFWSEIIKSDLKGTEKEIISKIEKNESKFIKEIEKKNENKNEINIKIRSYSPNLNEKRYINQSLKKINNIEIDEVNNNTYNHKKIINKGINSKLIYSQITEKNNLTNLYENNKNKNSPKGVFGKLSFFKHKPGTSESKSNNNINNPEEKISEENIELIIQKDYDDITDADYRQLLDKKSQYLETNKRLGENIKSIKKTHNKKYDSIYSVVQDNNNRLDLIKSKNELLEKEINNLNNVYQLTVEQEKIKYQLKQKEKEINQVKKEEKHIPIINKINTSSTTEKEILNNLESNDFKQKNKNKKENIENKNDNKNDNETREEKLEKIKKKYNDMNDDSIE